MHPMEGPGQRVDNHVLAYVALGANLGEPVQTVRAAFAALDSLPHTQVVARSSLYHTAPVGYADQPDFVNAVAAIHTALTAADLLHALLDLERQFGRERRIANGPRTLDLDLLLWADSVQEATGLSLPHPRMHERPFVLVPLLEIAPDAAIPGRGPAVACLSAAPAQRLLRMEN